MKRYLLNINEFKAVALKTVPELPFSEDTSSLTEPVKVGSLIIPNALAIQPMEGCDACGDSENLGAPSELTLRRYIRYAEGGAGLIWFEAVAVRSDCRANPRQLWLNERTAPDFARMVSAVKEAGLKKNGYAPVCVIQLTHSGRFARAEGPVIAYNNPYLNSFSKLPDDYPTVTDEYLDELPAVFEQAAKTAFRCGFDGVDVKACHCYLFSEMLSAFHRPGRYGGSFENRSRLYLDTVAAVSTAVPGNGILCSRINMSDVLPYGFGVKSDGGVETEFTEPKALVKLAYKGGVRLLNVTMGTPYVNPHVNRPYDLGGYESPEDRLAASARIILGAETAKRCCPEMKTVSTGFTWLRAMGACVAAGLKERGGCDFAGFGRQSFAYPEFARDIINTGKLASSECCVTCSKCTELMRKGCEVGCAVRDPLFTHKYLAMKRDK